MSRDWGHGAVELVVRPAPQVRAIRLDVSDARMPRAARQAYGAALEAGWRGVVSYARGNTISGRDAAVGPVVESVVLRVARAHARLVAFWMTKEVAACVSCSALLTPTQAGNARPHGPRGDACDGGGQPVELVEWRPGVAPYAFGKAWFSSASGETAWRVGGDELGTVLRSSLTL